MKYSILIYIFFSSFLIQAQNINIRVLSSNTITQFEFTATEGSYSVISNNQIIKTVAIGEKIIISRVSRNQLKIHDTLITLDSLLLLRGNYDGAFFSISSPQKKFKKREYDNDLYIRINKQEFELINDVNFDKYIAAVVQSEGGYNKPSEYYKAQAVLCRSYAARFWKKHIEEGHNLCDQVHCQAYKGRCANAQTIIDAAVSTSGIIIMDTVNKKIASAAYYSNSGGETMNSADLWGNPHHYLIAKPDPYSIGKPSYSWNKTIPLATWKKYLKNNGYEIIDSITYSYTFEQANRKRYLSFNGVDSVLELKQIRTDFKLRSTFFNITQEGDSIIVKGKGFGHGVGLSQEGAMEMARLSFTYDKILLFYFPGIILTNLQNHSFFTFE